MSDKVIIFDTTLRDGEQALQSSLTVKEKLKIALALERMRVDIMEVGFPVSSPGDFESVQTIAKKIKNSRVCGLARCVEKDIDVAANALSVADAFRIHIFMATSTLHIESKLKITFEDVYNRAIYCIKHARNYTDDIEFSCEDAGRTPIDNLCRIVEAAIHAGATTINIPDTVGYTVPLEFGGIIETLFNRVPNIDKAIISVHCHDDLGMSVANSITAIQKGARQIEGTINGLGERAGNCSLEEVIMAIKVRQKLLNVHTNINHQEIYRTSQIISQLTNTPVPANKAIVGSNAFSHSSGIHQDGILKNRETYEILSPESIGFHQVQLNLTSRSGRAAVKHRMRELGYNEHDYQLDQLYQEFLKLADKKGQVFDYDLEALVFMNQLAEEGDHFNLMAFDVFISSSSQANVSVTVCCGNQKQSQQTTSSNGPVDAIYQAIINISQLPVTIQKYQLASKGQGKNALGQVNIIAEYNGQRFHGVGIATDIIEASANALINTLNHVWRAKQIDAEKQKIATAIN